MIPTKQRPANQQPAAPQPSRMHESDESSVPTSGSNRWWIYAAVAVGAAAIAGALVFFLKKDDGYRPESAEAEAVEYADVVAEECAPAVECSEEYEEICEEEAAAPAEVPIVEYEAPAAEEAPAEAIDAVDFEPDNRNDAREQATGEVVEERIHQAFDESKVFTSVEQMPEFPGGQGALMSWVANHIKYPETAAENNVQGKVVVQFVVKKDGSIGDVKVVRSKDPDLDREAVRVVKTFPNFTPGKMNGQPVNVWYTLPVNFKLQGN